MSSEERATARTARAAARERSATSARDEDEAPAVTDGAAGADEASPSPAEHAVALAKAVVAGAAVGAALGAARSFAGKAGEPEAAADEPDEADSPDGEDAVPVGRHESESVEADDEEPAADADDETAETRAGEEADSAGSGRGDDPEEDDAERPGQGSAAGAVARASEQLADVLGREPSSVSAVERTDDGWRVTVEVVELERVPPSTDVLASYEVELDGDGELLRYARGRRYRRGQADDGGDR